MGMKIENTKSRPRVKPQKEVKPEVQPIVKPEKSELKKPEVKSNNFRLKVLPQMKREFLERITSFDIVSYVSSVGLVKKCPFTQDDWNLYGEILLSEDYDKIEYNSVETLMCVLCLEDFIMSGGFQGDNLFYRTNYNGTGLVVTGFINRDTNATLLRINNGEDSIHTCYYLEFNVKPVDDTVIVQPGKLELNPIAKEIVPKFYSLARDFTFSKLIGGRQVLGWDTCREGRFNKIDNGTSVSSLLYRFVEYRNIMMLLEELAIYSDSLRDDIRANIQKNQ